ncbi:MAG: ferrous iron transporter B, partial [Bacteroidales bacterium]|nr:ferrous iron transporter B [Bacteroidales bacterium]
MSEEMQIVCNQEYYVSKIYGCNDFKDVIQNSGIEIGKKISIADLSENGVMRIKVEGRKKACQFPKSYLNNISLVSTSDGDCHEQIAADLDNIKVAVMQTKESFETNIFESLNTYNFENYNISVNYFPKIDSIYGSDYPNKRFRNLLLSEQTDVFVAVVDFYRIETELMPIIQMLDYGAKIVILIRGYVPEDENGNCYDLDKLSKYLGMPIALYDETDETGESRENAIHTIVSAYTGDNQNIRAVNVNYGRQVEKRISQIQRKLEHEKNYDFNATSRFMAISLLESDTIVHSFNTPCRSCNTVKCFANGQASIISKEYKTHQFYVLRTARQAYIDGLISKATSKKKVNWESEKLTSIFTHKVLGFPLFLLFMAAIFCATFELGKFPMEWINNAFTSLIDSILAGDSHSAFVDFLANGLLRGIGVMLSLLPNLFIFFLLTGLMENSGYISQVSYNLDNLLHRFGLQAKSLTPFILGFGCSIPAVLSAKHIEDKKDRIIATIMVPFLPCAAKWPICLFLIPAFFGKFSALVMFAFYIVGILMAILFAKIYSKTLHKTSDFPYNQELVTLNKPSILISLSYMLDRSWEFVKRSFIVVVVGISVFWALAYFPHNSDDLQTNLPQS